MTTLAAKAIRWYSNYRQRRQPYNPHNPFLEGAFAPVESESEYANLPVTGKLPAGLNGVLARIGPNPQHITNPGLHHWFLGDGMVHGVRLQQGKATWYRSRFVGVDDVNQRLGRPLAAGKRRGLGDMVNTNIIGHAGSLWALVEAGAFPVELDASLNTLRHGLFRSRISLPFSAHPHHDPATGELHAICYDGLKRRSVNYVVIDAQGQLVHHTKIAVKDGPMMHDCAMSRTRMVILDLPITFSFRLALAGSSFPYAWNPRHKARVGLLDKKGNGKDVIWCEVPPCFVFHTANAYDLDDGRVVMEAVVHERMFDRSTQGPEIDRPSRFERWVIDPHTRQVERQVISTIGQEFPRIDERFNGHQHRYIYALEAETNGQMTATANALLIHDRQNDSLNRHDFGPDYVASEVTFVPRAKDAAEGDGWLLCFTHRLDCGNSRVEVLDAQSPAAPPLASIELPVRVPLGFHCNWIAD